MLTLAKESKDVIQAAVKGNYLKIAFEAKDVVVALGPAIDDVEKVFPELADLDPEETAIIREKLNEIAGRELLKDEWIEFGAMTIRGVKFIIEMIMNAKK